MATATLEKIATEAISFTHLTPGPYGYLGLDIETPEGDLVAGEHGKCQHCGTNIVYHFWLKGADAKIFFVGSTCIEKALLTTQGTLVRAVMGDRAKAEKARNKNKLERDYGLACNLIEKHASILCMEAHPKGFKKLSLQDYLHFCKTKAGKQKFVQLAKSNLKRLELWTEQ
jgi:hypothetical protein